MIKSFKINDIYYGYLPLNLTCMGGRGNPEAFTEKMVH